MTSRRSDVFAFCLVCGSGCASPTLIYSKALFLCLFYNPPPPSRFYHLLTVRMTVQKGQKELPCSAGDRRIDVMEVVDSPLNLVRFGLLVQ